MIDIKAIRDAAENCPSPWPMSLQPATVLALCDEVERLRKEVEADERNLCQLTDELAESRMEVGVLQHKVFHLENVIKAMESK